MPSLTMVPSLQVISVSVTALTVNRPMVLVLLLPVPTIPIVPLAAIPLVKNVPAAVAIVLAEVENVKSVKESIISVAQIERMETHRVGIVTFRKPEANPLLTSVL